MKTTSLSILTSTAVLCSLITACVESPVEPISQPPVVEEKPAIPSLSSTEWFQQVGLLTGVNPSIGTGPAPASPEWMKAVGEKSYVNAGGHGPDYGSDEWLRAVHRKVFRVEP